MIASLPMYDFPSSSAAWAQFYADWSHYMRSEGLEPPALMRGVAISDLGSDVFVSMICGAPYRNGLHKTLHLVSTLDFGVSVEPGYYHSLVLGAPKELTRFAVNERSSHSGFHAAIPLLQSAGIAVDIIESGSHWRSLEMVAAGEADLCSIDALSHRFIMHEAPELAELTLVAVSDPSPCLPLVTSRAEFVEPLRRSLLAMLDEGGATELRLFGLQGAVVIDHDVYMAVPNAESAS